MFEVICLTKFSRIDEEFFGKAVRFAAGPDSSFLKFRGGTEKELACDGNVLWVKTDLECILLLVHNCTRVIYTTASFCCTEWKCRASS